MTEDSAEDIRQDSRPNWRESATYKPLLKLDRAGWAWKWLRRNPDYNARMAGRAPNPPLVLPGSGVPVIPATDGDDAADWGLRFRRGAQPPLRRGSDFLAGRLGCLGGGGRGAASAAGAC